MKYEEYNITEEDVSNLRKHMAECIKNLNKGIRIGFKNAILKRLYLLEWRYGE